uniref:Uncharacterized protein n=1 Tax=Oryza barthii TaxID=65489 RepID=A0A0D3F3H9_9ORYZ
MALEVARWATSQWSKGMWAVKASERPQPGRDPPPLSGLTMKSVRCNATQTQSAQRKSSTATVKRSDPKGKTQGPKLDDGSGGFPPFRFGKGGGGGGGGGGGSNYFGGFLLFACVLLLDYLKEFEKNLIARRQRAGYDANNDMFQQ